MSAAAALEGGGGNAGAGGEEESTPEAADRVKERLEQAERAVEKFVARRLKAVQPGLEKVHRGTLAWCWVHGVPCTMAECLV